MFLKLVTVETRLFLDVSTEQGWAREHKLYSMSK